MNIAAARWVMLLTLAVTAAVAAPADYEYEEEVVPAKPFKPSPLLRQTRGPAIGRPAPKTAVASKSTTEAPPLEEEVEYEDEVVEEEPTTTTTEAPKRGGLRTGVVRPFRSNTDLIEALKRRRQQKGSSGSASSSAPSTTTAATVPPSDKSFKPGRRGSSPRGSSGPADQTGSNSERRPTVNSNRKFSTRGRVTEAPAEAEVEEEPQPTRSRTFGRGRRF